MSVKLHMTINSYFKINKTFTEPFSILGWNLEMSKAEAYPTRIFDPSAHEIS